MYGQHRKIDPSQVMAFKRRGLTNTQIARRLGVTTGAIYHVLRKAVIGENRREGNTP